MKVQATNPVDVTLEAKAAKKLEEFSEFRELLGTALSNQEQSKVNGKNSTGKSGEAAGRPAEKTAAQKDETKTDDAAAAQAAATAVSQEESQVQQPEAAQAGQTAQPILYAVSPQSAPVELSTLQADTGDGAAIEIVAEQSAEAAGAQSAEEQAGQQAQDHFGELLGKAKQELQSIAGRQTEAAPEQSAEGELTGQTGITVEAGQQEQSAPTGEAGQPVENSETAQTAENSEAGQTDEAVQPETDEQPVQPEAESGEEASKNDGRQEPQQQGARVRTEPEHRVNEQKPLREIPEEDRAVMRMRESEPREKREPEPVLADAARQPEPTVQLEKPVQTQQHVRQPMTGTEQMEQVRVQVTENLEQGKMEFRMQLQPEELGKVDVRMVLEGGRLAVEIIAASPRAAELLTKQAEGLIQSLRLQNLDVQSVNVVTESSSANSHMDGAFNMMNGQAQQSGQGGAGKPGYGGQSAEDDDELPEDGQAEAPEKLMDYAV